MDIWDLAPQHTLLMFITVLILSSSCPFISTTRPVQAQIAICQMSFLLCGVLNIFATVLQPDSSLLYHEVQLQLHYNILATHNSLALWQKRFVSDLVCWVFDTEIAYCGLIDWKPKSGLKELNWSSILPCFSVYVSLLHSSCSALETISCHKGSMFYRFFFFLHLNRICFCSVCCFFAHE